MADTDRQRVKITLFTLDEANRTALEIRSELEAAVLACREVKLVQTRLDALELAVAGAGPDNPDVLELKTLRGRRATINERLRQVVAHIQRRGCVVKDLASGLVDFYSLAGDRLIFLCWKLGEPEVSHWHSLDGGFVSRRPLMPGDAA